MEDFRSGGSAREAAWRYIAVNWSIYCCTTTIISTGCEMHEAKEAFSIACTGVDKRIRTAGDYNFLKTASLKTYLTRSTITAAWLVMRRRKKDPGDEGFNHDAQHEGEVNNWFRQKDCREILEKALAQIGPRCKKILILHKDGFGMNEIMNEMSLRNEDVAKSEKWQCQEKFKAYLRSNPNIVRLLKDNCYG
ncbi:hypothetical protein [Runella sp.]|uniref:RNA polymerase sigma factor n=1 Tax=Runella sp. TaxID=1960881 RepID=UPI0030195384